MRAAIPTYTNRDIPILFASMLPLGLIINYILWGDDYFSDLPVFLATTLTTFAYLAGSFITYGLVGISLRNRFPRDFDLPKRMTISLAIFFLMSAVYISFLLLVYDYSHFFGYSYDENDFTQAYITTIVFNSFLTFLMEGMYRFERFKATVTETEQLKKEYMQSQLLGLKSQMNPHFLFNCLNSLSSLINDDPDHAESFLDHMSKVYRYLLRNHEEQFVTIGTELEFIRSYYFLLKARHAEGLQVDIDIKEEGRSQLIPPLTLQMLVEHAVNTNTLSRTRPLQISIHCVGHSLEVSNKVQPRVNADLPPMDVIENIRNKYRLLCGEEIIIIEEEGIRRVQLPYIPDEKGGEG